MSTLPETISFPDGMDHDLDEGWHKLTSRQQGGRPARAIKEVIQNALDSYPVDVSIGERRGEIISGDRSIAIKDFGTGMTADQIRMTFTVGGTTKYGVNSMIGNFGIGFKQLFNFRLGTTRVRITTKSGDHSVEVLYTVKDPKKVPDIDIKVLDKTLDYGTMVEVFFNNDHTASECLEEARESLRYYPSRFTINGSESASEWDRARKSGAHFFSSDGIEGFMEPTFRTGESRITVLCKYERISEYYITYFMAGNTKHYDTIADYAYKQTPYLPGLRIVVNSNNLNVVISRDSFYCDYAYNELVTAVNKALLEYLADYIDSYTDRQFILANIYSQRKTISGYLDNPDNHDPDAPATRALKKLAEAKVFRVAEQKAPFSIRDIISRRTPELPLFYSPDQRNTTRWLGGQFKHDFVLTPTPFTLEGGLRGFYDEVLSDLFSDTINLDRIHLNASKLKDLVKRGIINPDSLTPSVKFHGNKELSEKQKDLQAEINTMLSNDAVKKVISKNFNVDILNIHVAFFEVSDAGMYISTGLFNNKGKPLADEYITNIMDVDEKVALRKQRRMNKNILLGLNLQHPLISYLCTCKDPNRAAYSLTYIVNQLIMCQRSLVPYSAFFNLNKANLAREMRNALLDLLTSSSDEDQGPEEKD